MKFLFFIFIIFGSIKSWSQSRPPQFILISFDGSYTNKMWIETREKSLLSNAKVTHFISGVDFLTGSPSKPSSDSTYKIYEPPRFNGRHRSDIGFGGNNQILAERILQISKSIDAGMEIGSHGNAHFDGTTWTHKEWTYEFDWFHKLLLEVFSINKLNQKIVGVTESDWQQKLKIQMKSFRAPYLGRGKGLWQTLGNTEWSLLNQWEKHQYTYDASDVARSPTAWPEKSEYGFWYFRMATIPVGSKMKNILSMDYNFYVYHSDNPAQPKDKPEKVDLFEEEMYQAYMNWFSRNYFSNRAPINIGHHFSTWNKGAYWKALQRFMKSVCSLPEVNCSTGQDLVTYLNSLSSEDLERYKKGNFEKPNPLQLTGLNIESYKQLSSIKLPSHVLQDGRFATFGVYELFQNQQEVDTKSYWKLDESEIVFDKTIDLISFAQSGVYKVTKVYQGQEYEYSLYWNPFEEKGYLLDWSEPVIVPCSQEAHRH